MKIEDFIARQFPVKFSARISTRADEQVILGLDVKMQTIKFTYVQLTGTATQSAAVQFGYRIYSGERFVYILQLTFSPLAPTPPRNCFSSKYVQCAQMQ